MGMAVTLQQYLAKQGIEYDVLPHPPTATSLQTAKASHVPSDSVAKAVVLKDDNGYWLAVLPASHHIRFGALQRQLDRRVGLATEREAEALFPDCAAGAIPAVGAAYGLDVVVDDSISEQSDIYFEAGDHASLVHLKADQFNRLMQRARHGRFSEHV